MRRAEDALSVLAREEPFSATNVAYWAAGHAHLFLGNIEHARRVGEQCTAAGRPSRRASTLSLGAWVRNGVFQETGQFDEAAATINEAIEDGLPPFEEALLLPELGKARLEAGDIEPAVRLLEEGLRKTRQYRSRQVQLNVELALARAYVQHGQLNEADALARRATNAAGEIESSVAQARWVTGLVAQSKGESDQAAEHFDAALKDLSAKGARPLQARVHVSAASLAYSLGDSGQVNHHLRKAYALYREMKLDHQVRNVESLAEQYRAQLSALADGGWYSDDQHG